MTQKDDFKERMQQMIYTARALDRQYARTWATKRELRAAEKRILNRLRRLEHKLKR